MPTKKMPQQFFYLGRRRLLELFNEIEATRPSWRLEFIQFKPPFVAAQTKVGTEPNRDNLAWLAHKITPEIDDYTDSILYPGSYVRTEMEMTWGVLPFEGLPDKIAWFYSFHESSEGKVFVALCGSVGNYTAYHIPSEKEGNWTGWYPSSNPGVQRIIRRAADNDSYEQFVADPENQTVAEFFGRSKGVIDTAFTICSMINNGLRVGESEFLAGSGTCEVLFEVFEHFDNINIEGVDLRAATIGAPLWVALPSPRPLSFPSER